MVNHPPFPFFTFAICQCKKLLMNLKLLLGYWKSLSLIFVMWFINNERGIRNHHLVYRQPPPRAWNNTVDLIAHIQPKQAFQESSYGDEAHI